MKIMSKRIVLSLPMALYNNAKQTAKKEYRSVSSLIRESLLEHLQDQFSPSEIALIEEGRKAFCQGKGVNWRQVKRG